MQMPPARDIGAMAEAAMEPTPQPKPRVAPNNTNPNAQNGDIRRPHATQAEADRICQAHAVNKTP